MKEGIIELDSDSGKQLGFTSDKFKQSSYLWKRGDYIYISLIETLNIQKGHLSALFATISDNGYGIKVPSPFSVMKTILTKKGFVRTEETSERHLEPVEVWVKEKNKRLK